METGIDIAVKAIGIIIVLAIVYGIYWLLAIGGSALLGWLGVAGFPKAVEWWVPLALLAATSIVRSVFSGSSK